MEQLLTVDIDVRVSVPGELEMDEAFMTDVLQAAANVLGVAGEVSVSVVSDEEIHALNRDYRGVDNPTDVLSFSLLEGESEPVSDDLPTLFGDIVVSLPTAIRQASEYGHSVHREVGFLLVHGFLHLNGYDHVDEAGEREMTQLQENVLEAVGLPRSPMTP